MPTKAKFIRFILCFFGLLMILWNLNSNSYFYLIEKLIKIVKSGKISKAVALLIFKALHKWGLPVPFYKLDEILY